MSFPELALVAFGRIPELSYRLETFVRLTERLQKKATLGNNDVMAFLVNAGQFKAVSDHISRNTRKPLNGFEPETTEKIATLGSAFRKQNGGFQKAAVETTKSIQNHLSGPKIVIDKMLANEKEFDARISEYRREIGRVFNGWLSSELARVQFLYNGVVGGLLVLIVLLFGSAWVLQRSILGQTKLLEVALNQTGHGYIINVGKRYRAIER